MTPHPILITDIRRLPDPSALLRRLDRGAAVILRHYDWSEEARLALFRRLLPMARRRGVALFWAGRPPRSGAPRDLVGLHLPEGLARHGSLASILLWRRGRSDRRLSMACHGSAALARARRLGVDFALLSPIFPTASHPGAPGLGPLRAALIARGKTPPLAALGGVNARTLGRLPPHLFQAAAGIFTDGTPKPPK